ncbi:glycosyltransferase family 2 protein [Actinoplanes flavus]|uniref:Glycosyltransferase n=1 Tax=Actinoplanes flavus TaxID=2820290 RepID=A0ABS3UXK7_9ACTN|nr:glycosyltransferase [Actinoplanes flavus]MBO3743304.1 glycosyltransferase [Actinoplanes flavus]
MARRLRPVPLRSRPRVTVVIPCYNYGHFLAPCLESFIDSDGLDVDVIVVDDASPDGSAAVAREIAARDARVRVIAHETNKRHIATYNEGLAAAEGEYVMLLSADDLLAPGALTRSAALLQANPEVGMVYGFSRRFTTGTPPPARSTVTSWTVWDGPEWVAEVSRRVSNPIYTPEVLMRTSVMRELAGYDARLPHAADFLLWLRAGTRAAIGRVNGVDQAFYRIHGANMHVEQYAGAVLDIEQRHLTLQILFDEDGDRLPDSASLRERSLRALAREALLLACRPYDHGTPVGDQAGQLDQLARLAVEIWPEAKESKLSRRYQRHVARSRAGRGPVVTAPVSAFRDRVVEHLGWRRWRATGISAAVGSL